MMFNKRLHFIGIGGISMSGIALILKNMGATITGSDATPSSNTEMLEKAGIPVFIGENPDLVRNADIIIYTGAISKDNAELKEAKLLHKEVMERAKFLGELTKNYENVICISGTHGKSTTTGMVSSCFIENDLNPTIQIGAIHPLLNANYRVGEKEYFIMESCEYQDSFLSFFPTTAVILNIDDDHLDYFKNIDNIKASFQKFAHLLPKNGNLILNKDDENTMSITLPKDVNIYTYGIDKEADIIVKNITYDNLGHPSFDIYYQNELYLHLNLNILGKHNIYNALASTMVAIIYNIDKENIKKALENYTGVKRRFELLGTYQDNILVYDDYAHHPTEIQATYNSVKEIKCHQNYAIFQSHTYSRTKEHLEEFANVLKNFDNIIIAPIYPAREQNIYNVQESDLVDLIKKDNPHVIYLDSFAKIVTYLKENLQPNDLVITIGAGPVNEVGLKLLDK